MSIATISTHCRDRLQERFDITENNIISALRILITRKGKYLLVRDEGNIQTRRVNFYGKEIDIVFNVKENKMLTAYVPNIIDEIGIEYDKKELDIGDPKSLAAVVGICNQLKAMIEKDRKKINDLHDMVHKLKKRTIIDIILRRNV